MTKAEIVARVTKDLNEFFDAIDQHELFIEDLDPSLLARLRAAFDKLVRR